MLKFIAYAAIFMGFVLFINGISPRPRQPTIKHEYGKSTASYTDERNRQSNPNISQDKNESAVRCEANTPEKQDKKSDKPFLIFERYWTPGTVVGAVVALLTFLAFLAALVAAIAGSIQAQVASKTLSELERPFLWIDQIEVGFSRNPRDNPIKVVFTAHIRNSGKIPAVIREVRHIVRLVPESTKLEDRPNYNVIPVLADHRFLPPLADYTFQSSSPEVKQDALNEWKSFDNEKPAMHFFGRVTYDDIRKQRRHLGFSFFVHPVAGNYVAVGEDNWNYW